MENWWITWQMSKIKQSELLQEGPRFRLIQNGSGRRDGSRRKVHHSNARPERFFVSLRCNLGQYLINWGKLLQQDHSLNEVNVIQAERS